MTPRRRRAGAVAATLAAALAAACVSTTPPSTDTGVSVGKASVEISTHPRANGPFLAAAPNGSYHAYWSEDNVVLRKVSTDSGATFGPATVMVDAGLLGNITAGEQQPHPIAAVVDDLGEEHVLVQVSDPLDAGRTDIYYAHVDEYRLPVEQAVVVGGRNLAGLGQFLAADYDPRTQQWDPIRPTSLGAGLRCDAGLPTPADADRRWDLAAVAHGGKVYVTGGDDLTGTRDLVQYYDPDRLVWLEDAPLPGPRSGHALVGDGTYLFAIGGTDGTSALGTIVRMDPDAGIAYLFDPVGGVTACAAQGPTPWVTLGGALGVPRIHPAATLVRRASGDLELYVVGGETTAGDPLPTVEAFRVEPGGVLTALPAPPPLPSPRSQHTVAAVGERIYVMGGTSDGSDALDDVLVLDLASGSPVWLAAAPMPAPRREHVAAVLEGKVYLLAGRDMVGTTTAVDVLEPATETWEREPESEAPYEPLGAAVAILSAPSAPRNISRQAANATQPRMARDAITGDIYAVWRNEVAVAVGAGEAPRSTSDVYLARSSDNGATFSRTPVRLSGLGFLASRNNNFSGEPRVAVGSNGVIHVTWIETGEAGSFDEGSQELIYTNCAPNAFSETGFDCNGTLLFFAAAGVSSTGQAPAGQMKQPAIATDGAGGVYLAWVDTDGTVPLATGSANRTFSLNVYFTWRRALGTFATPVTIGAAIGDRVDELFPPGSVADPQVEVAKLASRTNTPVIVAHGSGEVSVAWANGGEVRMRRSVDGGRRFLVEAGVAPLASGAERDGPDMVYQAVANRLVALWQTFTASASGFQGALDSVVETVPIAPL